MDGFAVRAVDTDGATPTEPIALEVTAAIAAGTDALPTVGRAEAVRIATGAPLPHGADAVVRLERAGIDGGTIRVLGPVAPGTDVRLRGEDVHRADVLVPTGTRLGPGQLAAIAATGAADVEVHRRPRVCLVITGDEVAPPGQPLRPGQVHDAIGPPLAAWCDASGATAVVDGPVPDDVEPLRSRLLAAAETNDLVVTVGGVSVGHRDHAREVVDEVSLWGVAVRPGRPFAVGRVAGTPWLGLPGNPAAAVVTFSLFVEPALRRLSGHEPADVAIRAVLTQSVRPDPDRVHVLRAHWWHEADTPRVAPVAGHGAGTIGGLARSNALIVLPAGHVELAAGESAAVRPLPAGTRADGR
jgi:molybdenum cofactor synthesis domain-containing protein